MEAEKMKYINPEQVKPFPDICGEIKEMHRGENYSTALVRMTAGKTSGEHYHKKMDETYHVLSGEGTFYCDKKEYPLRPGIAVNIQPGEKHKTFAKSALEILVITSPAFTVEDIFTD
jgi:mannose-6-phosphate isomerase-like protein (cupin superfamily)